MSMPCSFAILRTSGDERDATEIIQRRGCRQDAAGPQCRIGRQRSRGSGADCGPAQLEPVSLRLETRST